MNQTDDSGFTDYVDPENSDDVLQNGVDAAVNGVSVVDQAAALASQAADLANNETPQNEADNAAHAQSLDQQADTLLKLQDEIERLEPGARQEAEWLEKTWLMMKSDIAYSNAYDWCREWDGHDGAQQAMIDRYYRILALPDYPGKQGALKAIGDYLDHQPPHAPDEMRRFDPEAVAGAVQAERTAPGDAATDQMKDWYVKFRRYAAGLQDGDLLKQFLAYRAGVEVSKPALSALLQMKALAGELLVRARKGGSG